MNATGPAAPAAPAGPTRCPACAHAPGHQPRASARADGPVVCAGCSGCASVLDSLGLPGVFRFAHLALLRGVAEVGGPRAEPVETFTAEVAFVTILDDAAVGDDGRPEWRDAGWLLHDLEDWGLVRLVRSAPSGLAGGPARVCGIALTDLAGVVLSLAERLQP